MSDEQLLQRYITGQDEAAFAALMHRHGPMVLGVCKRILRQTHDAEDACQATFLVLARRALSIRKRTALGSWLHGVALRVARKLQTQRARRLAREVALADAHLTDPGREWTWREVQRVLDEELDRLPATQSAPLVLCYLEGKTQDEAARALGWPLPTLRGRLERARQRLRDRLTRRGITLSAALFGGTLADSAGALPATLITSTAKASLGLTLGKPFKNAVVSTQVAALVQGALKTMLLTKIKIATAMLAAVGLLGLATTLLTQRVLAADPQAGSNPGVQAQGERQPTTGKPAKPDQPGSKPPAPEDAANPYADLAPRFKEPQKKSDHPGLVERVQVEILKTLEAISKLKTEDQTWQQMRDQYRIRIFKIQSIVAQPEKDGELMHWQIKLRNGELDSVIRQIDLELLHTRLKVLQDHLPANGLTKEEPARKDPCIIRQGKITRVDDGGQLVLLDIGSDHGLKKGQTLEVYREQAEPEYLGRLTIVDIETTRAVGRLLSGASKKIKAGDGVGSFSAGSN